MRAITRVRTQLLHRLFEQGIGHVLFHAILKEGMAKGVNTFSAYILSENRRMLHLLRTEADIHESRTEQGVTYLVFTPKKETA